VSWLVPNGRLTAGLSAVVAVVSLAVFLGLLRVESPVALAALVLAVVTVGIFEGSFASLVVDGDRVEIARGLSRLRGRREFSVAHGYQVRIVTVDRLHRVELVTPDTSLALAAEQERRVAERIAAWLVEKLPAERLRVDPSGSPEDESPTSAPPEEQTRSQGDA